MLLGAIEGCEVCPLLDLSKKQLAANIFGSSDLVMEAPDKQTEGHRWNQTTIHSPVAVGRNSETC